VFEDITKAECKREHPDIDPSSWVDDDKGGWVSKDTVRRAEYFWCEYVEDEAIALLDGRTVLKSEVEGEIPPEMIEAKRPTVRKQWWWCKLLGGETEPIDKKPWPGSYLPIISVVGKEINIQGQRIIKGLVRDLKDPARMVNYSYSAAVESIALQNDVPYIAAAEALKGHETEWGQANRTTKAYLPFNAYDDDGNALPAPGRQSPAVMPAAQVQMLQLSVEQMRAASGQQNANFGIRSDAQSGIGIQRLKQQGEVATFHFPDNLARALRYEARVILDLIPAIYDTKRVIRVLGLDGNIDVATLDPEAQAAYSERLDAVAKDVERIFNPSVGMYDVVIDTGPSYMTQRQEAFAAMTDLASQRPELLQVAGDLIMRAADFPMAEQLAERLEKTLPPGLLDEKGTEKVPPAVQAKLQDQEQQMRQMGMALDQARQEVQRLQSIEQDKSAQAMKAQNDAELKARELELRQQEIQIDTFRAETERMKAQADAENAARQAQAAQEKEEAEAPQLDENGEPVPSEMQTLVQAVASLAQVIAQSHQALAEQQAATQEAIGALAEAQSAPKEIVVARDASGALRGRVVPTLQ
jgi:hypothetical protein